ncbi:MAG: DUF4105 domain-containing protein [Thiohalorhabdus sp.]|uniref:Lnb N-terminal periplasmic domain-containing protein n=1 Tax=Thiohalorhabdus sp. TaxID=3094134 RepID=UPI00397FA4B8
MPANRPLPARALLGLLLGLLGPAPAAGAEDAYLAELIQAAREQDLAASPQWRALLHYEGGRTGGESRADDPDFFFAPEGKTDPRAELEATLGAFFRPPSPHQPVQSGEEGPQHPQCAFPARYQWLKRKLDFDPDRLPERPCPRFEWWRDQLDAAGVTLVFPAAYLNNPSSMFGHTLLRLDRPNQTSDNRMLAYAVNYAADTGNDGGFLFAMKGLTGFYPGRFSVAPYYEKVKLYNDLESRDIWEYPLNFTQAEVDRMVRHLWELRGIRFDYYFFNENCSSQLLGLMEAARPSLSLSEQFDYWAIPADTVRAVRKVPGLMGKPIYRPALETQVLYRGGHLEDPHKRLAEEIAQGRTAPDADAVIDLPPEDAARTLELAYHYLRYLRAGEERDDESAKRARSILVARSRVDHPGVTEPAPAPEVRPDEGHRSARLRLGAGLRDGYGFQEIGLRPAYHDLLDPQGGYVEGAKIELLDLAVRRYERDASTEVHRVELASIVSLSPRDRFRSPISWKINTAADRYPFDPEGEEDERPWRWRTNGGAGIAWDLGGRGIAYALLEGTADASSALERGYALGLGPGLGVVGDPLPAWRVHLHGRLQRFGVGSPFTEASVQLDQRLRLTRNHALRLEATRRHLLDRWWTEGQLSWDWHF